MRRHDMAWALGNLMSCWTKEPVTVEMLLNKKTRPRRNRKQEQAAFDALVPLAEEPAKEGKHGA